MASYRICTLVLLVIILILLAYSLRDLNHIRTQQCYQLVKDHGQWIKLYAYGCE